MKSLKKNIFTVLMSVIVAGYIGLDIAGVIPRNAPATGPASTIEGNDVTVSFEQNTWLLLDAVLLIDKKTGGGGLPEYPYQDVYTMTDQWVFVSEDDSSILEAANEDIEPVAGGQVIQVFNVRKVKGKEPPEKESKADQ